MAAIVTETTVQTEQITHTTEFAEILQKFGWFPTQRLGWFINKSQELALSLEQTMYGVVTVGMRAIVDPKSPMIDSRECSSLIAALTACYKLCEKYSNFSFMASSNRF